MDYRIHTYSLPAALEEEWTAELWRRGIVGCEIREEGEGRVRVEAYFPADSEVAREIRGAGGLGSWAERGVSPVGSVELEDRDWLADYRASSRPFAIGERFVVDPRDPDVDPDIDQPADWADRQVLSVPAQNAFGTGSHESTRLAIEHLEALDLHGLRVLDVGCGSGILSIVAERLGAAGVHGYDLDGPSVVTARLNARRNLCRPILWAGTAECMGRLDDPPSPIYDLLLINVLPERILGDYPRLLGLLRPGGRVLSSGNLLDRRDELLARFAGLGLVLASEAGSERTAGEWVSFLLVRG